MFRCWFEVQSIARVSASFWVSARVPRRINQVGRASFAIWLTAGSGRSAGHLRCLSRAYRVCRCDEPRLKYDRLVPWNGRIIATLSDDLRKGNDGVTHRAVCQQEGCPPCPCLLSTQFQNLTIATPLLLERLVCYRLAYPRVCGACPATPIGPTIFSQFLMRRFERILSHMPDEDG